MKKRIVSVILTVSALMTLFVPSAFAANPSFKAINEGILSTKLDVDPVVVTHIDEEPIKNDSMPAGVVVRDADNIMPASANVSKTVNLGVGKSYSYGAFYMGSNTINDPNAGDTIEITVSAITSGKYKVIVKGTVTHSLFDTEEVYSYESPEYSTAKMITLPGEGGVAYTVTLVNTSAQNLKANIAIVTYQS